MSLKIDEYLRSLGALSPIDLSNTTTIIEETEAAQAVDGDSYVSTVNDLNEPIPCENYNNILQVMRNMKAENAGTSTSSDSSKQESGTQAAPANGKGSSSSDEEETTTKTVVINGITYIETTTTANGVTTVTRVRVGEDAVPEDENHLLNEIIEKAE